MMYGRASKTYDSGVLELEEVTFAIEPEAMRQIANFLTTMADRLDELRYQARPNWHVHIDETDRSWVTGQLGTDFIVSFPESWYRDSLATWTIEQICECLQSKRQRATYGALAGLLYCNEGAGRAAGIIMSKRPKLPLYSWIVSNATGEPEGYSRDEMHPDIETNVEILNSGLADFLKTNFPDGPAVSEGDMI